MVPFPIVGIGASAGGLQAFEEFFQALPDRPGMAFVLVSHLDPDHASILHELLQKSARVPVHQVIDGIKVEVDNVYVAPPGKDLAILNGRLQLMEPPAPRPVRLPIDYWFRSLAMDQQERAIGIILSGNGTDGTLGVKAIKGESGMAMAQDPESAKFAGMPESVISGGLIDYVLPPSNMPEQLIRYTRGLYYHDVVPEIDDGVAIAPPAALQKIFVLLRARTGHDFSLYKSSTLRRRIARRMNLHQIKSHNPYIRYLEENPQEVDLLFKELLIGVTSFFRDPEAFESIAADILPALIKTKRDGETFRVWVAGCSTGEEAFSLAILLNEIMERLKTHLNIQIFATDLDSHSIGTARAGLYPSGIRADVNPKRLKRYFSREDDHYRIKKEIRETVVFAEQNLIKDPPFTKLDMLSCRNLLIYFQAELQKQLLPLFHYALNPKGVLFLGTSETIGGFGDLFKVLDKKFKLFEREEGSTILHAASAFPVLTGKTELPPSVLFTGGESDEVSTADNVAALSSKVLSERFAPPSVVVNERGDLVFVHGDTGLYLQPAPGQPSHNVLAMAREGLRIELSAALRKASQGNEEVIRRGIEIKANGESIRLDLTASRINNPGPMRGLYMVTFAPAPENVPTILPKSDAPTNRKGKKGIEKFDDTLERELLYTRENLQSTIEELETSNEELKSTNEELQSTNEEIQSTNEELETSKEEMQSLNEELQTVNSELESKIEELTHANDDMTNLLNATDIATIFLDNDLLVKRFTHQATEVVRLIQSDVGRPLSDIVSRLDYTDLELDAQSVLRTLSFKQAVVRSEANVWYLMRIMPYRTAENVIDGLVITFVNIDAVKEAERALVDSDRKESSGVGHRLQQLMDPEHGGDHRDWLDRLVPYAEISIETSTISRSNQAAADLLGVADVSELIGVNMLDFVVPEAMQFVKEQFAIAVNSTEVESQLNRYKIKKRDGSIIEVEGLAVTMKGEDGPALFVTVIELSTSDVTAVDVLAES